MDYEKKYNEALERAKAYHRNEPAGSRKEMTEYIFPELRESEDERIRKALIDALKVSETIGELKFRLPYPTREECIAYLEKQKEHHIPWYDYQKSKEAGYTIVPNEEYEQLIKQKEQKPEDKEITLTNFEEVLNTFLFDFANSPIEDCEPKEYTKKHSAEILKAAYAELNAQLKQDIFEAQQEGRREGYEAAKAEQKPAEWSEEEKKFLQVAISCTYDRGYLSVSNWLKSLCPQPKAEWSEEDEKMVRFYVDDYNNNLGNMPMRDVIENRIKFKDWLLNRLKSLRPSWKPSEEQMNSVDMYKND